MAASRQGNAVQPLTAVAELAALFSLGCQALCAALVTVNNIPSNVISGQLCLGIAAWAVAAGGAAFAALQVCGRVEPLVCASRAHCTAAGGPGYPSQLAIEANDIPPASNLAYC